jgi:hypothetical protein
MHYAIMRTPNEISGGTYVYSILYIQQTYIFIIL